VDSKSSARTSDAIAGLKIDDALTDSDDGSCAAVAGALRLVEAAADGLNRRENSVALHFADDFPHQIGPGLRLLQQTLPGKFGGRALRAGRHDRGRYANQHAAGQKLWRRNFFHRDLARARVLEDLFQ
jgi:hypothetical protein